MRCSSRSTTWLGSALAAAGIVLLLPLEAHSQDGHTAVAGESAIRHAVVQAVKVRMGQDADVRFDHFDYRSTAAAPPGMVLVAHPEPGARLGRVNRFSLQWMPEGGAKRNPVAGGYVLASVVVSVEHVRAARAIERGETCGESDVLSDRGEVGAVLLQRLPRLLDVVGTKALRDLPADQVLTRTALSVRATVQSGDVVAVRAAVDGVTVQGRAVAQQSGSEGDVIRVVNRESRRALKVRVVGPGRVEVVQ
jgi:flagella basal body P-ring formation protein FlgA